MLDGELPFALIIHSLYLALKLRRIFSEPIETGEDVIQVARNIMNNSINGEVQDTVTPMEADFTDGRLILIYYSFVSSYLDVCVKTFPNFAYH